MDAAITALLNDHVAGAQAIACPVCDYDAATVLYKGIALICNDLRCVVCHECTHISVSLRPALSDFTDLDGADRHSELCVEVRHEAVPMATSVLWRWTPQPSRVASQGMFARGL